MKLPTSQSVSHSCEYIKIGRIVALTVAKLSIFAVRAVMDMMNRRQYVLIKLITPKREALGKALNIVLTCVSGDRKLSL